MRLPTPGDPAGSPVWENYIVAQAVQATLGQIPVHALAVGVQVADSQVRCVFQLSEVNADDRADMDDVVSELGALVGDYVSVQLTSEVVVERSISPSDGVRWIFLARP